MTPHPPPHPREIDPRGLEPSPEQLGVLQGWCILPTLHTLPAHPGSPQFRCRPPTPTDMIFLVDGSWSIGHSHFQQVKAFLASVIEPFEIGPDKVQVGGCPLCPALRPPLLSSPSSGRRGGHQKGSCSMPGWVGVPTRTNGTAGSWKDVLGTCVCVESWGSASVCPPGDPGQRGRVCQAPTWLPSSHARPPSQA